MTRRTLIYAGAAAVVACLSVGTYYAQADSEAPHVVTRQVTRGDIIQSVTASGTLETVSSVEVGSQVSGTVMTLDADFNAIVHKGQVVARLDPSLFETEVQQAQANLIRSQSEAERAEVAAADAGTKLGRARELWDKKLISATDLEAAEVAKRTADSQIRSARAGITQSQASLRQAEVTLSKTVIAAPIDGIVVARNVDVGQTVAASMSAPTLFVIAADLSKMRLNASIDESDVGTIREGQAVTFRVGAYPDQDFTGTVYQLRLNPVVTQNVVTYAAVIDVSNAELKLKPGMTATVTIETDSRRNVLRVPNAALQYRPTAEALAALNKNAAPAAQHPAAKGARQVWVETNGAFAQVQVNAGLSDGTYTELLTAALSEGTPVVTSVTPAAQQQARSTGTSDVFSSLQGGRPPGMPPGAPGR